MGVPGEGPSCPRNSLGLCGGSEHVRVLKAHNCAQLHPMAYLFMPDIHVADAIAMIAMPRPLWTPPNIGLASLITMHIKMMFSNSNQVWETVALSLVCPVQTRMSCKLLHIALGHTVAPPYAASPRPLAFTASKITSP
eukprot:4469297-Amphidinium_carterae.1